ncbi:MAPEG family protein [Alkalilacustris brevis]|uniref:MAPEG family protein n=1 Tax=Alkalilacustris brevis TaxID=2026338 RepID=UPI000E0DB6AF|nr:MAPEG family protein [Alkalilacustris brevis]
MTTELTVLGLAALLQALQMGAFSVAANRQVGADTALGPRDEPVRLTGMAGRLQRAMNNHFEALLLFAIAVVVLSFFKITTPFTAACAWAYLGARVLYVPAYAFGWVPWRSVIWAVGLLATLAILLAALFT